MFRRLIVYLFIVTSLSAQASAAFACEMMGEVVVGECCCGNMGTTQGPPEPSTGPTDACCTQVALIGADQAGTSDTTKSAFKALNPDLQPQPVAAVTNIVALRSPQQLSAFHDVPPESIARPGTRTYLNTLRLRI